MKKLVNIMVVLVLSITATTASAQCTIAWTGQNGNLVATSAAGGVSFGSYQGGDIVLQGGVQNNMDGDFGQTTSIPEVAALESFLVYPNPTSGVVFVDVPSNETVQIYSLQGQLVHTTNGGQLDITDLSAGTYIVLAPGYEPTRIVKQ